MAYKLAKTGVQANVQIREYICDAVDDIATLPDSDPFGSKVFVIETSETYVKSSDGEYVKTTSGGGGITPVGVINITQNGDHDVTEKATARVNVPVPPGYVIPTGSVDITANGTGIDIAGKAEANVNVPQGVFPSGTKLITQNVTGEDVTNYAAVDVAVPGPSGTKQISITANGTTTEDVADYADAEITVNVEAFGEDSWLKEEKEIILVGENTISNSAQMAQYLLAAQQLTGGTINDTYASTQKQSYQPNEFLYRIMGGETYRWRGGKNPTNWNFGSYDMVCPAGTIITHVVVKGNG